MNETSNNDQKQRPVAEFKGSGGIKVAVWKHKHGEGPDGYSIRIDRSYRDGDEFQSTQYLRDQDLLRTQKLIAQADDWIEQDKGRQIGAVMDKAR